MLPRVHGSAVFQRGETQALITVTLGTCRDEQRVDGLIDEYSKKFMLDYNFPPFSVGEVRPIRGPGRREIGHGALAERSVKPVLPDPEEFPYTIRVISDILESNGSSSMASVCGATLGLMAAGVPISNPVAGISIGLVKEDDDQWTLLTDIIGDEDHFGDMDFKVAGTQNGITGIQLDLKIDGISEEIIAATLATGSRGPHRNPAKDAHGRSAAREPRSPTRAPRLLRTKIDPEKIGALIGPGGKTIRGIQDATGAVIEVEDDGTVIVASDDAAGAQGGHGRRRSPDRHGASRPDLRRPRHQHQGFRRVHRDSARQGRPVPHQRAGRRVTSTASADVCRVGDDDAGQGDRRSTIRTASSSAANRPCASWA